MTTRRTLGDSPATGYCSTGFLLPVVIPDPSASKSAPKYCHFPGHFLCVSGKVLIQVGVPGRKVRISPTAIAQQGCLAQSSDS